MDANKPNETIAPPAAGAILVFVLAVMIGLLAWNPQPAAAEGVTATSPDRCSAWLATGDLATITFVPRSSDNAARYLLYRSENGGPARWSGSIAADASHEFTWQQQPDITYVYSVKTRTTAGRFTRATPCGGLTESASLTVAIDTGTWGQWLVRASSDNCGFDQTVADNQLYEKISSLYMVFPSVPRFAVNGDPCIFDVAVVGAELADFNNFEAGPSARVLGNDGAELSATVSVTRTVGAPPSECFAANAAVGPRSITFTPDDDDGADRYLLYRTEDGGGPIWSDSVAATSIRPFTNVDPEFFWTETAGVEYTYGVKTRGLDGGYSALTQCTAPTAGFFPAPVCQVLRSGPRVTIAWVPNGAPTYFVSASPEWSEDPSYLPVAEVDGTLAHVAFDRSELSTYRLSTVADATGLSEQTVRCSDVESFLPDGQRVIARAVNDCSVSISGADVMIDWSIFGTTADRVVFYARDRGAAEGSWQGSSDPAAGSFTKTGLANPEDIAWIAKVRTTLADGTRVFTEGVVCTGTDVDYAAGDRVAAPFSLTGEATVAGSTVWATVATGETRLPYPTDEQPPGCIQRDGSDDSYTVGYAQSSVWYLWTPGAAGTFDIDLDSPYWGGVIAAFEPPGPVAGLDDLAGTLVACGNEPEVGGGRISVQVDDPSASYFLQVSGDRAAASGFQQAFDGAFTLTASKQA